MKLPLHERNLYISVVVVSILTAFITPIYAEKKECDGMSWGDKAHDDNKPSKKHFKEGLDSDICSLSKDIDHMKAKGNIKNFSEFKETNVYKSADEDQKKCLKKAFNLGDSLADYEIEYCGTDKD